MWTFNKNQYSNLDKPRHKSDESNRNSGDIVRDRASDEISERRRRLQKQIKSDRIMDIYCSICDASHLYLDWDSFRDHLVLDHENIKIDTVYDLVKKEYYENSKESGN